jgi:hypothetical protein
MYLYNPPLALAEHHRHFVEFSAVIPANFGRKTNELEAVYGRKL